MDPTPADVPRGDANRSLCAPRCDRPGLRRCEASCGAVGRRIDHRVTTAPTSVIAHAGRSPASEEGGLAAGSLGLSPPSEVSHGG